MARKKMNGQWYIWDNGDPTANPPRPEGWVPERHAPGIRPTGRARMGNFRADGITAEDNELLQQEDQFNSFVTDAEFQYADNFNAEGEEEEYYEEEETETEDSGSEQQVYPAEGSAIIYASPRVSDGVVKDMNKTEFQIADGVFAVDDIVLINHPGYPEDYYLVEEIWDAPTGNSTAIIDVPYDDSGERNVAPYEANPVDHRKGTIEIVGNLSEYEEADGDYEEDYEDDEDNDGFENADDDYKRVRTGSPKDGYRWSKRMNPFDGDGFENAKGKKKKKGLFGRVLLAATTMGASEITRKQAKDVKKYIDRTKAGKKTKKDRIMEGLLSGGLSNLKRKKKKPVTKNIVTKGIGSDGAQIKVNKKAQFFTQAQAKKRKRNKLIGKQKGLRGKALRSFIRK